MRGGIVLYTCVCACVVMFDSLSTFPLMHLGLQLHFTAGDKNGIITHVEMTHMLSVSIYSIMCFVPQAFKVAVIKPLLII